MNSATNIQQLESFYFKASDFLLAFENNYQGQVEPLVIFRKVISPRLSKRKYPIIIRICDAVLDIAARSDEYMKRLCFTICHEIDVHAVPYVKIGKFNAVSTHQQHEDFYGQRIELQGTSVKYGNIRKLSRAFYFKNITEEYFKNK